MKEKKPENPKNTIDYKFLFFNHPIESTLFKYNPIGIGKIETVGCKFLRENLNLGQNITERIEKILLTPSPYHNELCFNKNLITSRDGNFFLDSIYRFIAEGNQDAVFYLIEQYFVKKDGKIKLYLFSKEEWNFLLRQAIATSPGIIRTLLRLKGTFTPIDGLKLCVDFAISSNDLIADLLLLTSFSPHHIPEIKGILMKSIQHGYIHVANVLVNFFLEQNIPIDWHLFASEAIENTADFFIQLLDNHHIDIDLHELGNLLALFLDKTISPSFLDSPTEDKQVSLKVIFNFLTSRGAALPTLEEERLVKKIKALSFQVKDKKLGEFLREIYKALKNTPVLPTSLTKDHHKCLIV